MTISLKPAAFDRASITARSWSAYRKGPDGMPRMPGAPWSLQAGGQAGGGATEGVKVGSACPPARPPAAAHTVVGLQQEPAAGAYTQAAAPLRLPVVNEHACSK